MSTSTSSPEYLRERVATLEAQVRQLEAQLAESSSSSVSSRPTTPSSSGRVSPNEPLSNDAIERYGRQMILPQIGVSGQKRLRATSVVIVGAGGLCSSTALYLGGSGIGRLGIVDYDTVERGNLHRQIIHNEASIDQPKSESACDAVRRLNPTAECVSYNTALTSANAMEILGSYDIVVDASDNVPTRYLLNDACVLLGKPLVSGSALRFEGQATVYARGGPCYRCLYRTPPPASAVTNCSDGGVLGVVPGLIGCVQAIEVLKLALGQTSGTLQQRLLVFDALEMSFRTMRLRGARADCAVCGDEPTVTKLIDYEQYCGMRATDSSSVDDEKADPPQQYDVSAHDYARVRQSDEPHVLLDVRSRVQFEISSLPNAFNLPLNELDATTARENGLDSSNAQPIYVICRRGVDSRVALRRLVDDIGVDRPVHNVRGGLTAWRARVDPNFAMY